jgi:hypothetical protein
LALGSILPTERPIHNTPVDIDPGKSWETKADSEFSATDLKDGDYVDRGSEVAGARTRHPWCDRRPVSGDGESRPILVDAGAIVAYGKTDVDDASSALHDRTQIGVTSPSRSAGSGYAAGSGLRITGPFGLNFLSFVEKLYTGPGRRRSRSQKLIFDQLVEKVGLVFALNLL